MGVDFHLSEVNDHYGILLHVRLIHRKYVRIEIRNYLLMPAA